MACLRRPPDRDAGSGFYRRRGAIAGNPRLLADRVDREADPVRDPPGLDHRLAGAAVEHERHRDDRLQRVALRAAGRRHVGFPRRHSDRVVEEAVDGLGRDAGAVVFDDDLAGLARYRNRDLRRDAGLLGTVDPVVDQLLDDDERPVLDPVAGLRDQLALGAEFEQPRCAECFAVQPSPYKLEGGNCRGAGHRQPPIACMDAVANRSPPVVANRAGLSRSA